ncbi:hypothetical protein V494_07857, partial [Pseudogymnoascus sp. VKM F-4513 (FW-928)]
KSILGDIGILTSASKLTPLLAKRTIHQTILTNKVPLTHPCSAYSSTDIACGALCVPEGYTCCPDKLGGCPADKECVKGDNGVYGCCEMGGKCTGDGVAKATSTGVTSTKTTSSKETSTATESKTDAETTTTGDRPVDSATSTAATSTGGAAAAYATGSGSMGALGVAAVAMLVL